ncbi:MAG: hypothetical protein JO218_00280 [Burkholderiales bacterium]|nr:hypothetical protein [Burkholderiales bacterium]
MNQCPDCGAPFEGEACPFNTDEVNAPWVGDHVSLADGSMSHEDHQLSVARWTVHQPPGGIAALRVRFAEIARNRAGHAIPCNAPKKR